MNHPKGHGFGTGDAGRSCGFERFHLRGRRSWVRICWATVLGLGWVMAGVADPQSNAEPEAKPQARKQVETQPPKVTDLRRRTDGEDWPHFLGPTFDGRSTERGIQTDWSKGLPIVWQTIVGEGYSSPTTSQGRLFLFDRQGDTARLRCLHAETGAELWRAEYPTQYEDMYNYSGGPRTSPWVDHDRVYTYGVEGKLQCRRVVDGELMWQVDTAQRYGVQQNFFGVGSSPLVHGDLLIAQVGGSPKDSPGIQTGNAVGNGTGIVAFDKKTGEERYRLSDQLASYSSLQPAKIDGRDWVFTLARGGLLAFDPREGKEKFFLPWRAKMLESVNAATPVVVADRVFITETYGPGAALIAVDAGKPRILWQDTRRKRSLASHWATPIHVDGRLFGSSGRSTGDSDLRAVELATGEVLWRQRGLGRVTLLYVDGHFVVLGEYGELHLVAADAKSYRAVGRWTPSDAEGEPLLAYPAWNAPVVSHGLLYVRGKDRLLALELIPVADKSR